MTVTQATLHLCVRKNRYQITKCKWKKIRHECESHKPRSLSNQYNEGFKRATTEFNWAGKKTGAESLGGPHQRTHGPREVTKSVGRSKIQLFARVVGDHLEVHLSHTALCPKLYSTLSVHKRSYLARGVEFNGRHTTNIEMHCLKIDGDIARKRNVGEIV